MRNILVFAFALLVGLSCKKEEKANSAISGTWRLITVYDKVETGVVEVAKPTGVSGDILLSLGNDKSYSAKTFARTFKDGKYSIENGNEIDFSAAAFSGGSEETEWGFAFLVMLTACDLQSIHPCVRNTMLLSNNRLTINTALRYNLVFEKLP